MAVYPVILCGGSGTRLWPASRTDRPKQFLPLLGPWSTFQDALRRLSVVDDVALPVIVTGRSMAAMVQIQSAAVDSAPFIIIEPEARDSAPAVAAAAAFVLERDPDGVLLMLAADHQIATLEQFGQSANLAVNAALKGAIATFGIKPDHPATGFGYIQPGDAFGDGAFRVQAFVEKPDRETAERYLQAGYYWNSGNFAFKAATLMDELTRFEPDLAEASRAAVAEGDITGSVLRLGSQAFSRARKISIDYAVMERTDLAVVVPAAFQWSDLGAWDAVWDASDKDADGNAVQGPAALIESQAMLVRSGGPLVTVIGCHDLVVIAEPDAVLIMPRVKSQAVKALVDQLKGNQRPEASRHSRHEADGVVSRLMGHAAGCTLEVWEAVASAEFEVPPGALTVLSGEITDRAGTTVFTGGQRQLQAATSFVANQPTNLLMARPAPLGTLAPRTVGIDPQGRLP